jgi:glycosyltransferase involved in cell wall biosynthesis
MKKIVMIGTRFDTMGGISSVVNVYREAGLFGRFPIHYIATHCDGGNVAKLKIALLAYCRFLAMLLSNQVGLLHIHVSSRASFWRKAFFYFAARLFRVPIIMHLHSGGFHIFYEQHCGPLRKKLVRSIFDHATRVIVLSQTWKTWLQTISSNRHIVAIYNPVLLPPLPASRPATQAAQLLVLGRLGKLKGSYDLLAAVAKIAPRFPALKLNLGGDGELAQVAARASELGITAQVNLLGWVRGSDKDQHLQAASIYLLPSYNEGMPMSVLEAMAAGLPVITTPVGGIPEAVSDGVEGFLVQPGDVDALADRLTQLLLDPSLMQQMGVHARHKIESTFSAEAILPHIEALYAELGWSKIQ